MSALGRLATWLGLLLTPFYFLPGLRLGQGGAVQLVASIEFIQAGSEIGIVLLLALLGLECTAAELIGGLRTSRRAGLLDAVLNALPGAALALLLGWGPVAAVTLAGVTWVSSSGVISKLIGDLGRITTRETPVIL